MNNNTQYYKTGKLVEKVAIISMVAIILLTGVSLSSVYALGNGVFSSMVISQEKVVSNGVFISRPAVVDERIRDIVINNKIQSINDYVRWLKGNIQYKSDKGGDNWAAPTETLSKKTGDCEDFAFFNATALKVLGYKPQVLSVMRIGNCHAITVFKESNGYYAIIDNNTLIRTQATTMQALAKRMLNIYNYASLCSVNFKGKNIRTLYKKSDFVS